MMEIYIRNVKTTDDDVADYEYMVFVNANKIAEGKVEGHRRADGWGPLVRMIGEQGVIPNTGRTVGGFEYDGI